MRLAISNIAWDVSEDQAMVALLQRYEVDAIDIAPGKYFSDPETTNDRQIMQIRQWWDEQGIEITGMQALLFGTTGLNLFGSPESQDSMLRRLDAVCRIASGLGAPRLVFGSPKNRDRSALDDEQTEAVALAFFQRLGAIAQSYGVQICLEPNPSSYGCNFMTTSVETASIVERLSHPAIRMQFDTGASAMNGEDPESIIRQFSHLIGHIHASEPNLVPIGSGNVNHLEVALALGRLLQKHVVSIEMVATTNEPHLHAIERSLAAAIQCYVAPFRESVEGTS